jgi:hypothetical protein
VKGEEKTTAFFFFFFKGKSLSMQPWLGCIRDPLASASHLALPSLLNSPSNSSRFCSFHWCPLSW